MDYAPAQSVSPRAARQLIVTKEGEVQHGLDVTGRSDLGRAPPIAPKPAQLDDQEGRRPG